MMGTGRLDGNSDDDMDKGPFFSSYFSFFYKSPTQPKP